MEEKTKKRIEELINSKKIFLFMKGTPEMPQCGFSKRVVDILLSMNEDFGSFDVLTDEDIRQGIKEYSDWPTIPQLYIDGKFVGGCDIVEQMASSGELKNIKSQ
jgi:monothiol glutaredoxin